MPNRAERGRGGPSGAAGVGILMLPPGHSGADVWNAGALSGSHTKPHRSRASLGALLDWEGWSVPNLAWGAAAAPNLDELETPVARACRASRLRPLLMRGTGAGGEPRLCLRPPVPLEKPGSMLDWEHLLALLLRVDLSCAL